VKAHSPRPLFDALPHGYLILDRDFTIVDVNREYLRLTLLADPAAILGRDIFEVFPDNPGDPEATGVRNLTESLKRVRLTATTHQMRWQRYDIRNRAGIFIERHWHPINAPVLDDNGEVAWIVHHVSDVTAAAMRLRPILKP
jgi:PAS domain-containing protein